MGILVQDNLAINHCLENFSEAYRTGDFEDISETLAENCLYESQWVKEKLHGKQVVADYLIGKSKTLKRTKSFPSCAKVQLYGPDPGRLGLLLTQKVKDKKTKKENENELLFLIEIDCDEKVKHISLVDPAPYRYEKYYTDVVFWGGKGTKPQYMAEDASVAFVTENLFREMYEFLTMVGGDFDEYAADEPCATIRQWDKALQKWKHYCQMDDFDHAVEKLAGVNYKKWTVRDADMLSCLTVGADEMWGRRKAVETIVDSLIEWTDTIRETSDHVFHQGW